MCRRCKISVCRLLFRFNENIPILKEIVTGDEKWIRYNKVENKNEREANEITSPKSIKGFSSLTKEFETVYRGEGTRRDAFTIHS